MTDVALPAAPENINSRAFGGYASLSSVCFAGSQEEAALISIDSGNDYIIKAHWHYKIDSEGHLEHAVYWSLSEDGILTLSGNGSMPDYSSEYAAPWYGRKNDITSIVIEQGVKNVGAYVFYNCESVVSVSLPDTLTAIGEYAFANCSSLETVKLPDSVKQIGSSAFMNCSVLRDRYSIAVTSLPPLYCPTRSRRSVTTASKTVKHFLP